MRFVFQLTACCRNGRITTPAASHAAAESSGGTGHVLVPSLVVQIAQILWKILGNVIPITVQVSAL